MVQATFSLFLKFYERDTVIGPDLISQDQYIKQYLLDPDLLLITKIIIGFRYNITAQPDLILQRTIFKGYLEKVKQLLFLRSSVIIARVEKNITSSIKCSFKYTKHSTRRPLTSKYKECNIFLMRYYNTRDLAKILGYNDDSYIRRLIGEGKLKAEKRGREWVVSEEDASNYRTKNVISTSYKDLFSLNHQLKLLVDDYLEREIRNIGPKDALVAFTLAKSYKTHSAIMALCEGGYGEDASILNRTIFELLITLLYILKDPTDERAYRYYGFDWILREKMFNYAEQKPELLLQLEQRALKPKNGDVSISEVTKMSKQVQDKYKYKGYNWSDKSLGEMAEEVNRSGQYKTMYRLSSQHTHSHARVMNDYVKQTENGFTNFAGISDNWVEEDLVMAFDFFSSIFATASDQYGWKAEKELKPLFDNFLKTIEKANNEVK